MAPRPNMGGLLHDGSTVGAASMMGRGPVKFTLRDRRSPTEMVHRFWRDLEMVGDGTVMAKLGVPSTRSQREVPIPERAQKGG